jgi:hypothetical protein
MTLPLSEAIELASNLHTFWDKVQRGKPDECWPWTACRQPSGYGQFRLWLPCKRNGKTFFAHRLAYHLTNQDLQDDSNVLHTCDNPPCCNPDHLVQGTQAENVRDMVRKGHVHSGRRSKHEWNIPSDEEQHQIVKLYLTEGLSRTQLARMFNWDRRRVGELLHSSGVYQQLAEAA